MSVAGTAFSEASLTAPATSNTSSFAAGTVTSVNSRDGSAVLSASGLRPGDARTGTLIITNTGDLPAAYQLRSSGAADVPAIPPLSAILDLTVEDITGAASTVYSGKLGTFIQADAGTLAAGESRTYRVRVSWPAIETDPQLQAAQTSLTFTWRASS